MAPPLQIPWPAHSPRSPATIKDFKDGFGLYLNGWLCAAYNASCLRISRTRRPKPLPRKSVDNCLNAQKEQLSPVLGLIFQKKREKGRESTQPKDS